MKRFFKILLILFLLINILACSKKEPTVEVVEKEIIEKEEIITVVEKEIEKEVEKEVIPKIIPMLTLENEQILAEFETDLDGIELKFDKLTINIPKEAYDSKVSFKIITKDIISDEIELIKPVSPLYEIDNGNVFAEIPIGLQISLDVALDEFVMPFYFDEENETLEGIPSIRLSNGNLLVITHHFSNIFIGMMSKEDLAIYKSGEGITTKFTPGIDDFSFVNYGSYIAPNGHCSGQSIAAMWYFKNIRRYNIEDSNSALFNLMDNNDLFPTPNFWEDDSLLYRFASSVDKDDENNGLSFDQWYIADIISEGNLFYTPSSYNAKDHWDAFYASMVLTHRPQLVGIYREEKDKEKSGHALIAYKIEGNKLYVADPNYPGDIRYIEYNDEKFKPYSSGSNASEIKNSNEIEYNRIYFLGEFSTINEWKVEKRWKEVISKTSGDEYFPYIMILSDGITSYEKKYNFNLEVNNPDIQDKMKFYIYDKNLNKLPLSFGHMSVSSPAPYPFTYIDGVKEKYGVELENEGDNWIGFCFLGETGKEKKKNSWIDFQWINIFVDTKLQLVADKYLINPGETAHIEASLLSGIEFPDLIWNVSIISNDEPNFDDEPKQADFKSKSYDFISDKLGEYLIIASDPNGTLYGDVIITVTDEDILEHDPISEEDSHIASGTYNCSFWKSAYDAVPFSNFTADAFYSVDHKRQLATDNANFYKELYTKIFGEITYDKENFQIRVYDDGTCDVMFSTFLFANSNFDGIKNIPFNSGNINWTSEIKGSKFEGRVILFLTDEGVKMEGTITKKAPEHQFMINETMTHSFEGEKID